MTYQDMQVKELSDITEISRHTISNYLNVRERIPTADVAVKIAKALGVSVEYLITGEENHLEKPTLGLEIRALIQNFKMLSEDDRKMVLAITQLYKKHGKRER